MIVTFPVFSQAQDEERRTGDPPGVVAEHDGMLKKVRVTPGLET